MTNPRPIKANKPLKALPKELRQIVVDTRRYKNKTSSTDILKQLRYTVK